MKKYNLALLSVAALSLTSCTEKMNTAFKVMHDKAEDRIIKQVGEGEIAIELYRTQYATLKERLVKMKTLRGLFTEQMDQFFANNDERRAKLYGEKIVYLDKKIPEAEQALKEFFEIYQTQKNEIKYIKDEIATFKSTAILNDDLKTTSDYEKRAESIKSLVGELKTRAKRAEALLEVGKFEETYTKQ